VLKTDFAANGGSYCPGENYNFGSGELKFQPGPAAGCAATYPNGCDFGSYSSDNVKNYMNGAVTPRFPVELKQMTDGASNTIFAAEKYLHVSLYWGGGADFSTDACADNGGSYQGYDWDNIRWATSRTKWGTQAIVRQYPPKPDDFGGSSGNGEFCTVRFGGPHSSGFNAVFCDGSVRVIEFEVDMNVMEGHVVRNDEGKVGDDVTRRAGGG
jgi:prepilin-type processing-associated H-X9-DG protein